VILIGIGTVSAAIYRWLSSAKNKKNRERERERERETNTQTNKHTVYRLVAEHCVPPTPSERQQQPAPVDKFFSSSSAQVDEKQSKKNKHAMSLGDHLLAQLSAKGIGGKSVAMPVPYTRKAEAEAPGKKSSKYDMKNSVANPNKVTTALVPSFHRSRFIVRLSSFRVQGSGFRVQGSGFRVQGSGFIVQGSEFRPSICVTSLFRHGMTLTRHRVGAAG
jgi:hypothetical protein